MAKISLTKGFVTEVDDDMFEELSRVSWCAGTGSNGGPYAMRGKWIPGERRYQMIRMHRHIVGAKSGQHVDHIDGNPLNNRRSNLRICSNAENIRNQGTHKGMSTKGVHFTKARAHMQTPWRAYITHERKRIHIGYFQTESLAQSAYNEAAMRFHGDFARIVEEVE